MTRRILLNLGTSCPECGSHMVPFKQLSNGMRERTCDDCGHKWTE